MRFFPALFVLSLVLSTSPGCSPEPPGLVRDPVSKVTGKLLIDGKPEPMVAVRLTPVGEADPSLGTAKVLTPSALTDAEGKFSIGTYDKGPDADGAPKGEFVVTVQWGMMGLIGGQYGGDKFNGKYMDPKKSEIKVTVTGKPVDLGVIELTTK